jgi:hypothetical protein
MKSTHPITYIYDVDGHTIEITRTHVRTAYARNGNVGNPTEYFEWRAYLNGKPVGTTGQRAEAYEYARAAALGIEYRTTRYSGGRNGGRVIAHGKNERPWTAVREEMQTNYRGRRTGYSVKGTSK